MSGDPSQRAGGPDLESDRRLREISDRCLEVGSLTRAAASANTVAMSTAVLPRNYVGKIAGCVLS